MERIPDRLQGFYFTDLTGKWESRSQDNYEIHTFKEAKSKFRLTWWASSNTFLVQGNQSSKIMKKIESLLQVPASATKYRDIHYNIG